MKQNLFTLVIVVVVMFTKTEAAGDCQLSNQRVYTTTDGSVLTSIAYITSFELSCKQVDNLYGEISTAGNNNLIQLVKNENTWLVSWTEDVTKATKGDHQINIYNEDGFNSLKKNKNNNVEPIVKLILNHPGAYNGPWLNSEHLAAIFSVVVGYIAVSFKSKLLN